MQEQIICNKEDLVAIADAVRENTGNTETYNVPELSVAAAQAIRSGTSGVSVQSDWNVNDNTNPAYIHNRTHYEAPPSFDITWDGVIGDRFAIDMSPFGYPGAYFVKVGDNVPTLEEMIGATFFDRYGDSEEETTINAEDCDAYTYPGVYDIKAYVIVCYDADALSSAIGLQSGIITNGTYFYARPDESRYAVRFVGRDNSKKLDTKYLPDGYPCETEPKFNIIWNGDMTGRTTLDMTALGYDGMYFVKTSDIVLSKEDVISSSYAFNWNWGNRNDDVAEWEINDTYPGTYDINSEIVVVYDQDTLNSTLGLPEGYLTNGVYFVASPTQKLYVARFTGKSEVKKLDGKYIPEIEVSWYNIINRPMIYTDVVRTCPNQGLGYTYQYNARNNIDVYSKSEVDTKIANINIDTSNYYSKSEVDTKIADAIGDAIGGSY